MASAVTALAARESRTGCVWSVLRAHGCASHETFHQALYLQGVAACGKLNDALRTDRARLRRKSPNPGSGARGKLKGTVSIYERPAIASKIVELPKQLRR